MWKRKTPQQKEWELLQKQEEHYLKNRQKESDSKLNQFLAQKVPDKLQTTLEKAFAKAFGMVFQKGVGVIEKTYDKETLQKDFQINDYAKQIKGDRKSFRAIRKQALKAGKRNMAVSGAAGIGMGLAGVGIPDIFLFTGLLFRSIYQIALQYGFSYDSKEERMWILRLICGAVTYGEEQQRIDAQLNTFIKQGYFSDEISEEMQISFTASALSKELLYMKFLQGIPVIGVAGGAYDLKYMKNITTYAELKYRRRYYERETK